MSISMDGVSGYSSLWEIQGISQTQGTTAETTKTSSSFTSGMDTAEFSEEGMEASKANRPAPPPPPPSESSTTEDEESDELTTEEFIANLLENAEDEEDSTLTLSELLSGSSNI